MANAIQFIRDGTTEKYVMSLEKQDLSIIEVLLDFIEETTKRKQIVHITAERQVGKSAFSIYG